MAEHLLVGIAVILGVGTLAQWIAWRIGLPSILLLLIFGFFSGPEWLGLLDPELLLGDLLLPLVAVATALILFEGGLSLDLKELGRHGRTVARLVSIGLLTTWALATLAGLAFLDLSLGLCLLLGAILTVSGPTVVTPLLAQIRPRGASGPILKWEGILIDPVGAMVAVLVFEGLLAGGFEDAAPHVVKGLLLTVLVGGAIGLAAAGALILLLKRYWIPDYLHNPIAVALVVVSFAASNAIQPDSGLLTVTLLGVVLANQSQVSVQHILEFKENLRVLLLSTIFIVLAARLKVSDFASLDVGAIAFVAALILVVRPIGVALCARGTRLKTAERLLISWVFPRGIVAAAVASVFALRLSQEGMPGAEQLVPMVFLVIVTTVVVYGLTAGPLATKLGLATPNPQGVLMVGAQPWARTMAKALHESGINVILVDSNWRNVNAARMTGLQAHYGNALHEETMQDLDLSGVGHLLALTPNDDVNTLVALHYLHLFGRNRIYKLAPEAPGNGSGAPSAFPGRILFAPDATYRTLEERFTSPSALKSTSLTEVFDMEAFRAQHGQGALPLFTISETGFLRVNVSDDPLKPQTGRIVLALVGPGGGAEEATADADQA